MDTLYALPAEIRAATTLEYEKTLSDYPAAIYTITLYIAGAAVKNVVATGAGNVHTFALSNAFTNVPAGTYQWMERAGDGTNTYEVASGIVVFTPNLLDATAGELQTWEEKSLAVVEAALTGQLSDGIGSYTIGGRAVAKIPLNELMQLRSALVTAVNAQKTGTAGQNIKVTFPEVS